MAATTFDTGRPTDPVALFEAHRADLIRQKLAANIVFAALFFGLLGWSIYISRFYPDRLATGLPRIFEYFGTVTPNLEWDRLFAARGADGRAVPGSLRFWYADFDKYLRLIFETILMAISATILGTFFAFILSFPAARNLTPHPVIGVIARRLLEVFRSIPEILIALVLVFAVGIGPLAGVIAVAVASAGGLGKLFSEVAENCSMRPVDGIRSVGGNWFHEIRYGVVPQILPNYASYTLLRFEINVRASSIVGFVGAGGIGGEINHVISFFSDDRVTAVLILVVLTVTAIDLLSERVRAHFIGRENLAS